MKRREFVLRTGLATGGLLAAASRLLREMHGCLRRQTSCPLDSPQQLTAFLVRLV